MKRSFLNLKRKINLYFWVGFVFTFLYIVRSFPSLSYDTELWAELATNFYHNARYSSFYENIWVTDAGYLPWLQRFISVIIIKVFKMYDYFPYICQFIGISLISFFCSLINLFQFRKIIKTDFTRFVISIVLGLGLFSQYDEFTFINFSYYGIFFIVLSFFFNKEKLSTLQFLFFLFFSVLTINAKGYFIVTLPIFLIHLTYYIWRKQRREIIYNLIMIFAISIQFITMINYRRYYQPDSDLKALNLFHFPMSLLNYLSSTVLLVFDISSQYAIVLVFFILVVLIFTYYHIKIRNYNVLRFVFIATAVAIASLTLNLFALSNFQWSESFSLPVIKLHRSVFISNNLIWFSLAVLFFSIPLKLKSKMLRYGFILFSILLIQYYMTRVKVLRLDPPKKFSYSQWRDYKVVLTFDDFCLPVNPYNWQYQKDCKELSRDSLQNSNIRAIIWEKNVTEILNRNLKIKTIVALDKMDKPIGTAHLLNTINDPIFQYYLFQERVSPHKLKYYDEKMEEVDVKDSKMKIYGALK